MKDLIDLANRVFDVLVKKYGELPESRTLFLYTATIDSTWFIINSSHSIKVSTSGAKATFAEPEIDEITKEWLAIVEQRNLIIRQKDLERTNAELAKIKSPQNQMPKDGQIFNMWGNEGEWREIKF